MPDQEQKHAVSSDPACVCVVAALEDDPFYRSICAGYMDDAVRRRGVLARYFAYSIQEGREIGRCVHLADAARGVAVWLLPQTAEAQACAARRKRVFLAETHGAEGCANYYRIVSFMREKAASVVGEDAWYLSIVAVDPAAQGQGLGRKLLDPTLAEADRVSATCYLETFGARTPPFYERLGFVTGARFMEPTTGAEYAVMMRYPRTPAENSAR